MKKVDPEPLIGNPSRAAKDSMDGYVYQNLRSVLAWLRLEDHEILYLEAAEDFELVSPVQVTAVQVKRTSDKVTLNNNNVLKAITNYWELKELNKDRSIRYRYLTTSAFGKEQKPSFEDNKVRGIQLWKSCQLANGQNVDTEVSLLRDFLIKKEEKLGTSFFRFLKEASLPEFYKELIQPFDWATDEPSKEVIINDIKEILILKGNSPPYEILASNSEKAIHPLYCKAQEIATSKEKNGLKKSDFIQVFDDAISIRVIPGHYPQSCSLKSVSLQSTISLAQQYSIASKNLKQYLAGSELMLPILEKQTKTENGIDIWQPLNFNLFLKDKGDYIIVNASGIGKTTSLYYLNKMILSQWQDIDSPIPLLVSCHSLTAEGISGIELQIKKRLELISEDIQENWSNLCILIDGLDQAKNKSLLLNALEPMERYYYFKDARIVITSREYTAIQVPEYFQRIRLTLPSDSAIRQYLGEYYDTAKPLLDKYAVTHAPIMLDAIRKIIQKHGKIDKVNSRAGLFKLFWETLCKEEVEKPYVTSDALLQGSLQEGIIAKVLEKVAFDALRQDSIRSFPTTVLEKHLSSVNLSIAERTGIRELIRKLHLFEYDLEEPDTTDEIFFRHQSFQAYFAARYLYNQNRQYIETLLQDPRVFFHDTWREVLAFYAGMIRDEKSAIEFIDYIYRVSDSNASSLIRLLFAIHCTSEIPLELSNLHQELFKEYDRLTESYGSGYKSEIIKLVIGITNIFNLDTELIEKLYKDQDTSISSGILAAIGQKFPLEKVEELFSIVHNSDSKYENRYQAVWILSKILPQDQADRLIPFLQDGDLEIRYAAMDGLSEKISLKSLDELCPLRDNASEAIRLTVIRLFSRRLPSERMGELFYLLNEGDADFKRQILQIFISSGRLLSQDVKKLWCMVMKEDIDVKIRIDAIHLFKDRYFAENRDNFFRLLQDKDSGIIREVVNAIGEHLPEEKVDNLLTLLRDNEQDPHLRVEILRLLGKKYPEKYLNDIILSCSDEDVFIRRSAVTTLIQNIAIEKIINNLTPLLYDPDPQIRLKVFLAIQENLSLEGIGSLFIVEQVPEIKYEIIQEIIKKSPKEILFQSLNTDNPYIRYEIVKTLIDKFYSNSVENLSSLLKDPISAIRALVLSAIGDQLSSKQLLEPLLDDTEPDIRMIAALYFYKENIPKHFINDSIFSFVSFFKAENYGIYYRRLNTLVAVMRDYLPLEKMKDVIALFLTQKGYDSPIVEAIYQMFETKIPADQIEILLPLLTAQAYHVRIEAVRLLGRKLPLEKIELLTPYILPDEYNYNTLTAIHEIYACHSKSLRYQFQV